MSLDQLLLPFQFPFMQNAFWIILMVGPPTALLSCFLVLKGWALMGDAVSHATLPGVVLAWVLNIPLIVGAFAARDRTLRPSVCPVPPAAARARRADPERILRHP